MLRSLPSYCACRILLHHCWTLKPHLTQSNCSGGQRFQALKLEFSANQNDHRKGDQWERYQPRLTTHFEAYQAQRLPGLPDGVWVHKGQERTYPHILPKDQYQLNILPSVRDRFWNWFGTQKGEVKLHRFFHHLNSSQALCFNLFFPFLKEDGKTVDPRLLQALGIDDQGRFTGHFERVFDKDENTNFDLYLESDSDQRIFFELKYSEAEYGSCKNDPRHCDKLEKHYRPHLREHIDAQWLEQKTFFRNYQILRNMSYLGRHIESRLFFIFPKANQQLAKSGETIAKIQAKSFANV